MYCILKYIDVLDYKRLRGDSNSALKSIHLDEVDPELRDLYFNPDCLLQLILEYICGNAQIDVDSDFDLCTEGGTLLGVKDYKPTASGSAIFIHKEAYFIVMLTRGPTGNIEEIKPLVADCPSSRVLVKVLSQIKKPQAVRSRKSIRRLTSSRHSMTARSSTHSSSKTGSSMNHSASKTGSTMVHSASKAGSSMIQSTSKTGSTMIHSASKAGSTMIPSASKAGSSMIQSASKTGSTMLHSASKTGSGKRSSSAQI